MSKDNEYISLKEVCELLKYKHSNSILDLVKRFPYVKEGRCKMGRETYYLKSKILEYADKDMRKEF